jgi:hypothetical protein
MDTFRDVLNNDVKSVYSSLVTVAVFQELLFNIYLDRHVLFS